MVDLLKRFGHVIAAIVIAWYGYSALDDGGSGLENKPKPLRIPQSALPLRTADETLTVSGDPFFREWSPYGPEYSPEAIAAHKRAVQEAEEAEIRAKREARIKAREGARKKKVAADQASGASAFRPFVIELESVLALSSGGVARISGHTVRVGESLRALDAASPPVLAAVHGTTAEIDYRGKRIVLDISKQPIHRVTSLPGSEAAASDKPAGADKPVLTVKPAPADKPAPAGEPAAADKPAAADEPATGEKPAASDKPAVAPKAGAEDADTPSDG